MPPQSDFQSHTTNPPHPSFARWIPDEFLRSNSGYASPGLRHLDQLERSLTMQHAHTQQHQPPPHPDSLTQRASDQSRAHHYSNPATPTLGASQYPPSDPSAPTSYSHQHIPPQHAGMAHQPHYASPPTTEPTHTFYESEAQLERLVNKIAHKLLQVIQNDEFLDRFLNTRELLEDNKTLAGQVQQLLRENKKLEAEVIKKRAEMSGFKRIVGNLFLKMDN